MRRVVIRVAAAVIEREGKILIGQRRRNDSHPLKWEFPGGKLEAREEPAQALRRELLEELGITARVDHEMVRHHHSYPTGVTVQLIFFRVTEFEGEPQSLAFEQIVWETPDRLSAYDFVEGDVDFVLRLASGEYNVRGSGAF